MQGLDHGGLEPAAFQTDSVGAKHADLDGYQRRRRPIARATVTFTNLMTRASIIDNRPSQLARNAVFSLIGVLPAARKQMALHMSELA